MGVSVCCRVDVPWPQGWNFGDKVVDRARWAISENCRECLTSYGLDGQVLAPLERNPLVHGRVAALGLVAEALRDHSP